MWEKTELVELNKAVGGAGTVINEGGLELAVLAQGESEDPLLQLAHVVEALVVDHIFEDFNKQTAVAVMVTTFEELKLSYDPHAVADLVTRIARRKIRNVRTIRGMIRDVIR